jgi:hypothetical protein
MLPRNLPELPRNIVPVFEGKAEMVPWPEVPRAAETEDQP